MINKTIKPFNYLGYYNIDSILKKIDSLDWNGYTNRQEIRYGMQDTETVPIIWEEKFKFQKSWNNLEVFSDEVDFFKDELTKHFGEGILMTCVLTKLPKQKNIDWHYDCGSFFNNSHRIHIPIITNDDVIFKIGDEEKNMKVGEMWEINNNNLRHGVFNNGNNDRIHLMFDWLKEYTCIDGNFTYKNNNK